LQLTANSSQLQAPKRALAVSCRLSAFSCLWQIRLSSLPGSNPGQSQPSISSTQHRQRAFRPLLKTDHCPLTTALLGRRHTIQFSKSVGCPRGALRLPGPLPSTLRPSFDGLARMLGLIPPLSWGDTKLSNLTCFLGAPLWSATLNARTLTAAEFDYFELRGLKQAGSFLPETHLPQALIRKPFAYRPPRNFNRVDVEL